MKTFQKTLALALATFTTSIAFGQLGLGVTSTTQAAVNTTASTAAVATSTNAAAAATKSTVNATVAKTTELKTTTVNVATTTGKQTVNTVADVKTNLKNSADVNAGFGVQSNTNAQATTNNAQANSSSNSAANVAVDVNGKAVIEKTDAVSTGVITNVENKTTTAVETTKAVIAIATSEVI